MTNNTVWMVCMVPERKRYGNITKDRKIHDERNVWSAAQ